MSRFRLLAVIAALVGVMALALAACGDDDDDGGGGGGGGGDGGGGGSIALLLPESKTARYESQDRPNFERKVKELCSDCPIIYSNADQDAAKQQQQAEAAITNGAKVLVLDPVDAASAGAIVNNAKSRDIPVVSYDRLITDADIDYYISFDNEQVGKLQGESLVNKLKEDGVKGSIIMINGAPTDNNAKLFKEGAHSVIDGSGFNPKTRPTTGQDAELAAIQRILIGEQYMTVYKAIKAEAEAAAELAVALAKGEEPTGADDQIDNGMKQVPSILLTPVAVTKDNIQDTIIKDEFWSVDEICTGKYAAGCKEAGIQ
jgi:D-xylose transport system substrate-binding protein